MITLWSKLTKFPIMFIFGVYPPPASPILMRYAAISLKTFKLLPIHHSRQIKLASPFQGWAGLPLEFKDDLQPIIGRKLARPDSLGWVRKHPLECAVSGQPNWPCSARVHDHAHGRKARNTGGHGLRRHQCPKPQKFSTATPSRHPGLQTRCLPLTHRTSLWPATGRHHHRGRHDRHE